jgi:hypothetical protein
MYFKKSFGVFVKEANFWSQAWWHRSIIPVTQEVEFGRIMVLSQPEQHPISTNKLGMVVHNCNPSYMGGIGWRVMA